MCRERLGVEVHSAGHVSDHQHDVGLLYRRRGHASTLSTAVTRPVVPSTVTTWPSVRTLVPLAVPMTAGMPYSRATIAACEAGPPESTTTAAARWNSVVQAGLVYRQTSTSPAASRPNSAGSRMTATGPVASPLLLGVPVMSASPLSPRGKTAVGSMRRTPANSS